MRALLYFANILTYRTFTLVRLPVAFVGQSGDVILYTYATEQMWQAISPAPVAYSQTIEDLAVLSASNLYTVPVWWRQSAQCTLLEHASGCECGPINDPLEVLELTDGNQQLEIELCQVNLLGQLRKHLGAVTDWVMDEGDKEYEYCLGCVLAPMLHAQVLEVQLDEARLGLAHLHKKTGDIL